MKPLKPHISQVILWRDFNSTWEFHSLDSVNLRKVKHVSQHVFFLSVSVVLCLFLFSPLHAFFLLVLPLFFLLPPFFFILFPRGSPRCLEETWVRLPISWCEKVTKDSMVSVVSCRPLLKRGFKKKGKPWVVVGHRVQSTIRQTQATAASLSQRAWCRESNQVLSPTEEFLVRARAEV